MSEPRRIALHRAAAESWGEEAVDTMMELVTPPGEEPATRSYEYGQFAQHAAHVDAQFAALSEHTDTQFAALREHTDAQFSGLRHYVDDRFEALGADWKAHLEERLNDVVVSQTRALVFSQLATLVVLVGLIIGLD